jgi:predicted NBD/HSP70 family sugar kinase
VAKPSAEAKRASRGKGGAPAPLTLAIDIGGTRVKASVLDRAGAPVADRVDALTPHPAPPAEILELIRPWQVHCLHSIAFRRDFLA